MRKLLLIASVSGLTACTDTLVGLGFGLGGGGVTVRPSLSSNVGGVNVTVGN
jgi:hypothetical protein